MKKNYYLIDIFKYIFCLGIVALHTNVQDSFGDYRYWIQKSLLRLGVPFFFMVSGFMLERKLAKTNYTIDDMKTVFLGWTKRLVIPLIVFEGIAIILDAICFYLEGESILMIAARTVRGIIFYPGGATWYLQACIVGVWIIYLFIKKQKRKWIIPCGSVLYIFALVCNSYNFVISNTRGGIALVCS